ncbi:ribosomal protein L25/Gln-tRNA synthetase [Aspergillus oleicola]
MDWKQFWAVNKRRIDTIAARYTAIPKLDAVTATIDGINETSSSRKAKHNKNSALGTKEVMVSKEILIIQDDAQSFRDNGAITLMNWGNAVVLNKTTNPQTGKNTALHLKLDLTSGPKKTEKKITWLAKEASNMIPVELYYFDHLITKDKLDRNDDLSSCLTKPNYFLTEAWAAAMLSNCPPTASSSLILLGSSGLTGLIAMVNQWSCSVSLPVGGLVQNGV